MDTVTTSTFNNSVIYAIAYGKFVAVGDGKMAWAEDW